MPAQDPDEHRHGTEHHWNPPEETEAKVRALESLLVEAGVLTPADIDQMVDEFETNLGPMNGAKVVAKAWVDPAYRERLLADASTAIEELGFRGLQTEVVVAVENSPTVHHMVVCTLCSCYPWTLLGIPPTWFKDNAYRSRSVLEPRSVLADFGVTLGPDVEVKVWDTSAEVRYLVIPQRPAGTEQMAEAELADLVTRDSMLGVGFALAPEAVG
ncbi:MAG: nitrile hydratase subunit alpha [Actinomycetota bacterium]|jgi:nitrile hydratase|nr:nitrile hydratase subunit alpha [Actinomycetota bacterium]